MTGIILAGGKNSRMGTKKAFLRINGSTIIDNILTIYKRIFSEIIIVTNTPEDYEYSLVRLVRDIVPGKGPLGGLYTALMEAKDEYCFITACDMPFVREDFIRYILSFKGYDIVVPEIAGYYEPLCALYSKNCIPVIKGQLEKEKLSILEIFAKLRIKEVHEDELKKLDKSLLSLINVNTKEEFKRALNLQGKWKI